MSQEIPAKLRWACRRGMLELDVLLGCFLEERFTGLSSADQSCFIELLNENDQDLFSWLTGKEQPARADYANMVEEIRQHAIHRH